MCLLTELYKEAQKYEELHEWHLAHLLELASYEIAELRNQVIVLRSMQINSGQMIGRQE